MTHLIFEDEYMRRKRIVSIMATIVLAVSIMSGCSMATGTPSANFTLGMAATTATGEETVIAFLDSNLNLIYRTKSMKYAGSVSSSKLPAISKAVLYCSPEGEMGVNDETTTIAMNLTTGRITKYDNGEKLSGPSAISANDKAYYIARNLNGVSTIGRRDFKTKKIISANFDESKGIGFTNLLATDRYVFCSGFAYKKNYIYKLDADTLKICGRIKITSDAGEMSLYGNKLYFALTPDESKNGKKVKAVGEYDLNTNKTRFIRLNIHGVIGRVQKYKNCLIVPDENIDEKRGNYINIYDLKSGKNRRIEYKRDLNQIEMKGDKMYILGGTIEDDDKGIIDEYQLRGMSLKLIKEKKITDELAGMCVSCIFTDSQSH